MKKIFRLPGNGVTGGRQIKGQESQKHRVDAGRGLWRSPSPTQLLKQGQLQQAEWAVSSWVLCISAHAEKLFQCFTTLIVSREYFYVQREHHAFLFVPIALCPILSHHRQDFGSSFFLALSCTGEA